MSSFVISPSSIFSLSSSQKHPSRLCFVFRNPRSPISNFASSRLRFGGETRRTCLSCNCSNKGPGDTTGSNENENRNVLDAFFLGKALAEVINERIESTVGEVLGTIGRFQAEQQKQVQEIQEEVLERAKRAKERAARESMEARGLVPSKQTTINQKPASAAVTSVTPTPTVESITISSNENLPGFSGASTDSVAESSSSSDEDSV